MCIDYWFRFSQFLPLFFQHSSTPSATSTSGLEPSKPQHLTSPIQEWWDKRPASNAGFRWRKQAIIHQKWFNLIFSNILCKKKNIGSFMEFSQLDDWDMRFFCLKKAKFSSSWIKKTYLFHPNIFNPVSLFHPLSSPNSKEVTTNSMDSMGPGSADVVPKVGQGPLARRG